MKVAEIAFVAYPVTDFDRARGFYEGVLGLQASREFTGESYAWIAGNKITIHKRHPQVH
jgi:extradiol dioxygenase family protein